MRGLTSTIVLLLILAGLAGYVYFADPEEAADADARPTAFEITADDIEEIAITTVDGETTRVQRVDGTWQIVEPVEAPADAGQIAVLTSSLESLEVQRVVDENPAEVTQYGLEPPRLSIAFRPAGGQELQRLLIGDNTPTGGDLYARTSDGSRVFLISSYFESTFNRDAFNLRDKAILRFDRDNADVVAIEGPASLQFTRDGTEWRIAEPIEARADYAVVEGLVTRLAGAQMQEIVAEDASNLAQYGLDAPALRVNVGTGSERATLLVGEPNEAGLPFAKDAARPVVFTIEESLVTELSKPVADFRRKDVFDFRAFTANRVELRRESGTQVFEKATGEEGQDVWRDASGNEVDAARIDELLSSLTSLRAQSFDVAPPSMQMPELTAMVRFDENRRTETVTFAREGGDVFAARADEPGAARLEAGSFDAVIQALDALK